MTIWCESSHETRSLVYFDNIHSSISFSLEKCIDTEHFVDDEKSMISIVQIMII
jgi:hypothetical protein